MKKKKTHKAKTGEENGQNPREMFSTRNKQEGAEQKG